MTKLEHHRRPRLLQGRFTQSCAMPNLMDMSQLCNCTLV